MSDAAETNQATEAASRRGPCPCGSGKKFKNCHEGREAELAALLEAGGPEGVKAEAGGPPKAVKAGPPPAKQRFGPPPARANVSRGASTKAHRRV